MDWYLEPSDTTAVRVLRGELERYLRRHSEPGSDVEGAVIAFSELVTNALQHTSGPVWISVDWSRPSPVLSVHDLGPGFTLPSSGSPPVAIGGFGLYVASQVAQELQAASKRAGGSKVTAVLPVRRRAERSFDPPRRRAGALPTVEEAKPDGNFGRESFLRALAVQLAQTLELTEGPEAAQAAVAQVGTDVGGSMEEAYRRARGITERLGPAQMADLYVTLKRAIDGDFYVIEANEERVVLGNRACPFGEAVKRSPASAG